MIIGKRCWVAGRVQGVFYRATTRQQAQKLGVKGYAKNLPDGRVEVLAIGEPSAVSELAQWLWQGSSTSSVTAVEVLDVNVAELDEVPTDFATR